MNTAPKPETKTNGSAGPLRPALLAWVAGTLLVLWAWQGVFHRLAFEPIPYSEFKRALAAGEIVRAAVGEREIEGELVRKQSDDSEARVMYRTARVEDPQLTEKLLAANVETTGVHPSPAAQVLLGWLLPRP